MDRLLAITRRPETIVGVISETVSGYELGGDVAPFRERFQPLAAMSDALCPWKGKDVNAWRALARVPHLGKRARLHVVRAVMGSVVDPETQTSGLAPLEFGGDPVDVRPYLCGPDTEQMLIDLLGDATADTDLPGWHWTHRQAIVELPAGFRVWFLWGLHLSSWNQVLVTLGMYDALGLEQDAGLRSAVARLLSHATRPVGIQWCELLSEVPPRDRIHAAALVVASSAYDAGPTDDIAELLVATRLSDAVSALSTS